MKTPATSATACILKKKTTTTHTPIPHPPFTYIFIYSMIPQSPLHVGWVGSPPNPTPLGTYYLLFVSELNIDFLSYNDLSSFTIVLIRFINGFIILQ